MKSASEYTAFIILGIIIFIFVILAFFFMLRNLYAGPSFQCTMGFAIDGLTSFAVSPVIQASKLAQSAAEYTLIAVLAFDTISGILGAASEASDFASVESSAMGENIQVSNPELSSKMINDIESQGDINNMEDIAESIENPTTSSNSGESNSGGSSLSGFLKGFSTSFMATSGIALGAIGVYTGAYALQSMLNSFAHSMQVPVLRSLCPLYLISYNTSSGNLMDFYQFINTSYESEMENHKNSALATLFIDKYIFYTYQETLHASVRIAKSWITYQLLLAYYGNSIVTYKDLLCMLYAMKFDNQNLYELMYSGKQQASFNYGITNPQICEYLYPNNYTLGDGSYFVGPSSTGAVPLIGTFLLNLTNPNSPQLPGAGYVLAGPGIYLINIVYDGINHIIVESYYVGNVNISS